MTGGWVSSGNTPTILTRGVGRRIGRIDDAERRLAARHEQQRGAHALGRRDSGLYTSSRRRAFRGAALPYFPAGTASGVGHRERAAALSSAGAGRNPGLISTCRSAVCRRDQTQLVAEQALARVRG